MWKKYRGIIIFLAIFVVYLIIANYFSDGQILTLSNINTLLMSGSAYICMGYVLSFSGACAITDFSMGSMLLVGSIFATEIGNSLGMIGFIFGGLGLGILCMVLNIAVFRFTKVSTFIASLAMVLIYESITLIYSMTRLNNLGLPVALLDADYRILVKVPWLYIILGIVVVAGYFLYNRTSVGLNIRAVGSNQRIAELMGIKTGRMYFACALIAGIFMGVAIILYVSFSGKGYSTSGLASIGLIFRGFAALLLADLVADRINRMIAIPITSIIVAFIFNTLTMLGVQSGTWQQVVLGTFVVVLAVISNHRVKGVVK